MSEQLPPPPESEPPAATPPAQSRPTRSSSELEQLTQILQATWKRARPILAGIGAVVLDLMIQLLNRVQRQLEAETEKSAIQRSSSEASSTPNPAPPEGAVPQLLYRLQEIWQIVLGLVRSRLPKPLRQTLPDGVLTIGISALLAIVLWTTSSILPGGQPQSVAKAPSEPAAPPALTSPELGEPIAVEPPLADLPLPSIAPPVEEPPPPLQLTPEQQLIARIQDQVAEVTDHYASGLIQSVQANFKRSRLTVKVSDGWYELGFDQQDGLANEVFQRSQTLDFEKLELLDSAGTLLARSPVVGDRMIVLQR
ncbi:hypothetical protein BST81_00595 [Leptolyngbya sp. 'hensonii']|uniref:hypothetical protein n=1 Tax=Leptolyngbya sp. 'hensonii' TaxID=1922337 RepID=UPI00094F50F5|nr:hypothetical protein [Leptolyngbya sp. 'hensonii']OLP20274.1 hypothetical protein BST81_00595 [Leptolyngbya sp. 'hensonii']